MIAIFIKNGYEYAWRNGDRDATDVLKRLLNVNVEHITCAARANGSWGDMYKADIKNELDILAIKLKYPEFIFIK